MTTEERRIYLMGKLIGADPACAWAIVNALAETNCIFGDVCEFGVAQGATSAVIANEMMGSSDNLHLFDSFAGLPPPTAGDALIDDIFKLGTMEAYAGTMANGQDQVLARLAEIEFPGDRVVLHAGFFSETLKPGNGGRLPSRVRFAFVDVDLYESTSQALSFLAGVMPAGAMVIVHDYGFFSAGVERAVGEAIPTGAWNVSVSGHLCTLRRR